LAQALDCRVFTGPDLRESPKADPKSPLLSFRSPSENSGNRAAATEGIRPKPRAFTPSRGSALPPTTCRAFHDEQARRFRSSQRLARPRSARGPRASSLTRRALRRPTEAERFRSRRSRTLRKTAPLMRFLPLQRVPHSRQRLFEGRASHARPPAPSGFLNLLTLQSAPSLPALFHAGSAPGVRPSEPCSSRAAVRRLRRRCPLDVATPFRPTRVPTVRRERRNTAPRPSFPMWIVLPDAPHLQGFAPHESPPHHAGGLGRTRARSSPGIHPLQGILPRRTGDGLHRASPHEVARLGDKSSARALCRVLLPDEIGWSLSRLPTLLGFATS
jgi:hypothetical protein